MSIANRVVARLLRSPAHRVFSAAVCLLEVRGAKTGRIYQFPVQYARDAETVIIWPGHPERKTWWRNLRRPAPVGVWLAGVRRSGTATVLTPADVGYDAAVATYRTRFPKVADPTGDPLVRLDLDPTTAPAT